MCDDLKDSCLPFGYADDVSLWYEIDPGSDPNDTLRKINADLARLKRWGDDNNTTFEKSKMEMVVVLQKRRPFNPDGVVFDGFKLPVKPCIKLVGYTIDSNLRWGQIIDRIAKKARSRIVALRRIQPYLTKDNVKTIYTMFIRSVMEYGSVTWMGAANSHLSKLDRV